MIRALSKGLVCAAIQLCAGLLFADQAQLTNANPQLDDAVRAFEDIPRKARSIEFRRGDTSFPAGGHFQGIQAYFDPSLKKQVCFVSRNSGAKAYFITMVFDPDTLGTGAVRHLQYLPSDGRQPPLRHPGGMQRIGKYLVVGVEDNQGKRRSQIQFWDVSKPLDPKQRTSLTVIRESTMPKDQTAGAVGIVQRANDHLLVVANWDAQALDFYVSNGLPLGDDACRFSFRARWAVDAANRDSWTPNLNWGSYQCINLVSDGAGNVFLLGFHTSGRGENVIDLFSVNLSQMPPNIIRKVSTRQIALSGGVQFQYAAGIFVRSSTELACYATERHDHDVITVNVSP